MNFEIAQRIIDEKPEQGQHIYIDEAHKPRDKHIENLFRDLYDGKPLDDIFRNNFEVYAQELLGDRSLNVPRSIFIDAATAERWVGQHVGTVTARPLNKRELAAYASDPDHAPLRHLARIKSPHARGISTAYAPHHLHAVLLAAVFVFRAVAGKRLAKLFAPAMK